jgi:YfiH family protein
LNLGYNTGDDRETVSRNWDLVLASQSLTGLTPLIPKLCHGDVWLDADLASPGDTTALQEADAVFTRQRRRAIAVTTADCLAALIVDTDSRCIAAVHAGWRGTRDHILGKTLAHLFASGRCQPATTHVALGPCLSLSALELGDEVAQTLPQHHIERINNRPHFDLRGCNREQAIASGVHSERLSLHGACTFGDPDLYFSYRRSQRDGTGATGRLAAYITLI